ncbi:MAG: hypothetical protein EZS28_036357 [Streblomastix strix]|uniref:Uncharacterized protein n=1 Tax=Streblomastix strix TaxID=222440 RepID=A0A5J4UBC1_9EUKA|nr:MAG: hypothetical protein EZS28_036357 [Streblomastix strix]
MNQLQEVQRHNQCNFWGSPSQKEIQHNALFEGTHKYWTTLNSGETRADFSLRLANTTPSEAPCEIGFNLCRRTIGPFKQKMHFYNQRQKQIIECSAFVANLARRDLFLKKSY